MKPISQGAWITIAVLAFFLGSICGGTLSSRSQPQIGGAVDTSPQLQASQQNVTNLMAQGSIWKNRAETCEANFQGETVLYEPGPPLNIPVMRGMIDLQAGPNLHLPNATVPRWVLPASIVPRAIGNTDGFTYVHIDGKTQRIDGPFLPLPLQQNDRYNVNGWVSQ